MDIELYKKVDRWVEEHRHDIISDIIRLVNIPSVSENSTAIKPFGQGCHDVLDEMLKIGTKHGFQVHNYDYYCGSLYFQQEKNEKDIVGIWGHLDVVPEGDNWDYCPYNAVYKDGYIIGRGSQDNKGPSVAIVYVLKCLNELGVDLKHPIKLFFGCDEENKMRDVEYFVQNFQCPKISIIADCGFPVCYGEKGIIEATLVSNDIVSDDIVDFHGGTASNVVPQYAEITLKKNKHVMNSLSQIESKYKITEHTDTVSIRATGISKHSAFPEGSINAIYELTNMLCKSGILTPSDASLIEFLNIVNHDNYGTKLNIACSDEISGLLTCVGGVVNLKNRHLSLGINIRYPITTDSSMLLQSIHNCCTQHGFNLELVQNNKPNYFPKEYPIVQTLTNTFNEITHSQSVPFTMAGGTYARKLPHAFAFGMGGLPQKPTNLFKKMHGDYHQPDEGLNIDNLLKAMKIYCMSLIAIDDLTL